MEHSPNIHYRNELIIDTNILSCRVLLQEYGYHPIHKNNESILFSHYYALGVTATDSPQYIIDLTLSYAKGQSSDVMKRIGEISFPLAKDIDDTLAFRAVDCMVNSLSGGEWSTLIGKNADYLSDSDAQSLMKWSRIGLEYAESLYGRAS